MMKKTGFLLILFALMFSPIGSTLVHARSAPAGLQVITPENVKDLRFLRSIGQGSYTGALEMQPGGDLMAVVTESGIALVNRNSGKQTAFIPIGFLVTALTISPDGQTLAVLYNVPTRKMMQDSSVGFNGPESRRTIALYSLPKGERIGNEITELQECSKSNVWQMVFSADGKSLIFEKKYGDSKADAQKMFCKISIESGKITEKLEIPANADTTLSPDGRFAAIIQRDKDDIVSKAVIIDTGSFQQLTEISFSPLKWPEISFTRRGDFVLRYSTGEGDDTPHTVQFWSLPDAKPLLTLEETERFSYNMPAIPGDQNTDANDRIMSQDISPDGQWGATGSQNGKVKLWNTQTGLMEKELGVLSWICHSLTGHSAGSQSSEMNSYVNPVAFSSDGKTLAAAEWLTVFGQSGQIHIYQIPDGKESFVISGDGVGNDGTNLAFSPDGSRIAYGGFADNSAQVFDVSDGKLALRLTGHSAQVNQVEYSPDGKWIATASDDSTIRLWDAISGQSVRELRGHTARVNQLTFSVDGQWLVSGADDNTIRRWQVSDGSLLETRALGDEDWRIDFLAVLADGHSVVYTANKYPSPLTGFVTRQMVWDIETGKEIPVGGNKITIRLIAKDGKTFEGFDDVNSVVGTLGSDGKMTLLASGIRSPYGNGAMVNPVISPDNRLLISGNGFGIQAWELKGSSAAFLSLVGIGEPIPSYAYVNKISPDGTVLAFAMGGVVYLMGVPQ